MYYVCMIPDLYPVYCEDEALLRQYLDIFTDLENPNIYCASQETIDKLKKTKGAEELNEPYKGSIWMTDPDMEFVADMLETDVHTIVCELKVIRKLLKFFKGESSKNLNKAIKEFLKERIPNSDFDIDEFDPEGLLLERVKFDKYVEHVIPQHRDGEK